MIPVDFPEANTNFKAPASLEESQVAPVRGYHGIVERGSVEGLPVVVVAWQPDAEDLTALNQGKPIFLSTLGFLPPHFLSTSFEEAKQPA